MHTVEAELAVACIVDKDDLGELYGRIFDKKQALEKQAASSTRSSRCVQRAAPCLSHAAGRRRSWHLLVGHAGPHGAVPVVVI